MAGPPSLPALHFPVLSPSLLPPLRHQPGATAMAINAQSHPTLLIQDSEETLQDLHLELQSRFPWQSHFHKVMLRSSAMPVYKYETHNSFSLKWWEFREIKMKYM